MMLALMSWCIISVVKLHPTSLLLVPSPVASSSSFLSGMYGLPRNGIKLDLTKSKKSLAFLVLPRLVPRCCVPIGIIKPCGTRKARMYGDGSKRDAPELRFAQTYASCIDQPCMRLFFALSAAMSFVVMGADCTNTYANSPSPTQATYVRIDDAYANWYLFRQGKEGDRSLVLPVLKALEGHPEAGALWEKHINKILDDFDIVYTPHTSEVSTEVRSTERSSFCADKSTTSLSLVPIHLPRNDLICSIGKIVDLKSQGILNSINGIDIDQRREYVQVSCQSYLARMLKAHGWDKPSPTEKSDSKPIEALAASTAEELSTSVGPAKGSTEHRTLEKQNRFQLAPGARRAYVRVRGWTCGHKLRSHPPCTLLICSRSVSLPRPQTLVQVPLTHYRLGYPILVTSTV
jgi:hypothetical protein